ncbi:hypothetical protein TrLO_g3912 [Triparma laevis f. longispina]|uniref:Uncharacterized protein n=1 Tax=Triparma laevis f. longispina TaxID=1714387 RepID=A0A9W7KZE9_9STRA|nr:hypothetical protein TrLO_g3912 [Triparma laevis f. longispina]
MTNGQLLAVAVIITLQVVEVTPFKAFAFVKVFPPSTPPPGQQESNLPRQKRLVPDSRLSARPNEEDEDDRGDNPISNFFNALDDFIDDATMRKLGGGAKFYGKRKSGFYGKNDSMKKQSKGANWEEDYQGPTNTGYFVWKKDEESGEVKPMTRLKGKVIEKPKRFWESGE